MAGPFGIQRVPRGLLELLSLQGGLAPNQLDERIRATLDVLQCYGLQQLQTIELQNAAAAELASVSVIPSVTQWSVLYQAQCLIVKTATQTALIGSVAWQRTTSLTSDLRSAELGPYGASATGVGIVSYVPDTPKLLPPNSAIVARALVIGTDATADVTVRCEFGLLG